MSGAAALLVVMTWLAPDGFLLGARLQSPDDLPALPLETLVHTAAFLDIEPSVYHGAPHTVYLGRGLSDDQLWPQIRYAAMSFRSEEGGFPPRHRLGLDVVEYWAHSLTLAWLDAALRGQEPYIEQARQRALVVMPEVPQEERLPVYLESVADFVSQIVSVAHEVDRTRRRWQRLGRDICTLRQPEIPLMRHWRGLFEQSSFRGTYRVEASDVGPMSLDGRVDPFPAMDDDGTADEPLWATTRQGLARADKDLIVQHLFAGRWKGDSEVDFAALCDGIEGKHSP